VRITENGAARSPPFEPVTIQLDIAGMTIRSMLKEESPVFHFNKTSVNDA
jgi:hypothetical protein